LPGLFQVPSKSTTSRFMPVSPDGPNHPHNHATGAPAAKSLSNAGPGYQ
jgi:hypothetical protein